LTSTSDSESQRCNAAAWALRTYTITDRRPRRTRCATLGQVWLAQRLVEAVEAVGGAVDGKQGG
jgi:hypothetical protein